MTSPSIARRKILKGTASAIALFVLHPRLHAQSPYRTRANFQQFKTTPQYTSFVEAIRAMRNNPDPTSPSSLQYWANVHMNYCPHGAPYFIAWHRGYLYYFEEQLRAISGDSALNLPYWDYYANANIPSEFSDPAPDNPLYVARNGNNVYNALDLAPFDPSVYNFQRGTFNAFEPQLENAPHNPVHDLLGGVMATMQSPLDPIFFLHHANIDRLTHAWALPDGKGIPYTAYPYSSATSSPYWSGEHVYDGSHTMDRYKTCDPSWLGYDYDNVQLPNSLPSASLALSSAQYTIAGAGPRPAAVAHATAARPAAECSAPPEGNYTPTPGRTISASRRSLGGVANVRLGENSLGARISLPPNAASSLADCLAAASSGGPVPAGIAQSVHIVLDQIAMSSGGKRGGYFYNFYLNFPPTIDAAGLRARHFLGTLGPFQIACLMHRRSRTFSFPATEMLLKQAPSDLAKATVSCVRVNGDNTPTGQTIGIGEVRVEISTDEPWDRSAPLPHPTGWYR